MKKFFLSAAVLAVAAGAANAAFFIESEGNNTTGAANNLGTYNAPGEGILVDGSITPGGVGTAGDVDWFRFTVTGGTTMVASIFSLNSTTAGAQLILVQQNGAGFTVLAANGGGNPGGGSPGMSSLAPITLAPGQYWVGIAGSNDLGLPQPLASTPLPDGFEGAGTPVPGQTAGTNQNFTYKLIVGLNIVPTPGAAALVGLGGLAALRRRR